MADNISVKDASNNNITLATTDNAGVHTPKHIISSALPAGTNNIGDVDVLTVPADPFGANADAAVAAGAAGSIQAKLRRLTTDLDALKTSIDAIKSGLNFPATVQRATFLSTSSGNSTIVAAASGLKTKVVGVVVSGQGTVVVAFTDGLGGTIRLNLYLVAGVPVVLPLARAGAHWFETSANTILGLNSSGAINVSGEVLYYQEP